MSLSKIKCWVLGSTVSFQSSDSLKISKVNYGYRDWYYFTTRGITGYYVDHVNMLIGVLFYQSTNK